MKKIFQILTLLVILFVAKISRAQTSTLSGLVLSKDEQAISYVNIGIKNKKIGVLTDQNGHFEIKIPDSLQHEMLTFSCVGFETKSLNIYDLKKEKSLRIYLNINTIALPEVTFKNRKLKPHRVGIKGRTPMVYVPSKSYHSNDIVEQARIFQLKDPIKILNANIFLSYASVDTIKIRLNFYSLLNGIPNERLINKSIIKTFTIDKGWLTFDLSKDDIYLNEDFAVSFEFLPEISKSSVIPKLVYGAKIGTPDSFVRLGSQANWQKNELGGASIFLTVE